MNQHPLALSGDSIARSLSDNSSIRAVASDIVFYGAYIDTQLEPGMLGPRSPLYDYSYVC